MIIPLAHKKATILPHVAANVLEKNTLHHISNSFDVRGVGGGMKFSFMNQIHFPDDVNLK